MLSLLGLRSAHAQVSSPTPANAEPAAPPPHQNVITPEIEPETPWWRYVTAVPIVLYTPETQFGFGAGLLSTWQLPGAFRDRPSNVIAYGIYTTRKQTVAGGTAELHFRDDRWVLWQDLRYVDWPDRFYGIGNHTRVSDRQDYTDHYSQAETELLHRVISRLYLGLHHQLRFSDSEQEDRALRAAGPLGVGSVHWHGLGAVAAWDTRKGLFWPERGSFLHADVTRFGARLGSDFSATLLRADLRHYQPLWRDHVLAMRLVASGTLGDVPLQLMPMLGGPLLFRGWYQGRLRDRVLGALEFEYRVPLSTRWALVGFGSVGRVASRVADFTPRGLHAAGGVGGRFAVVSETRANFRLDIAYGDALYVYLQFKEAF
ncbi:MAG: BamA/TamA family outer membrane protein [Myxococcales bacterium]